MASLQPTANSAQRVFRITVTGQTLEVAGQFSSPVDIDTTHGVHRDENRRLVGVAESQVSETRPGHPAAGDRAVWKGSFGTLGF